jgi:hypothetical protein
MNAKHTALACLAATALLAGCGNNTPRRVVAPPPKLPPTLAARLASLSDSVARKLDAGDSCGALGDADELQATAAAAVATHSVPRALRSPLTRATTRLAAHIRCVPPPAPHPAPAPQDEHGKGKHEGHGKEGD